jgi:chromate transporter
MQRDLGEEHGWRERQDMLDGVALGQTMPGPLAAQVTMSVSYLRKGAMGTLGTATAFMPPSFLAVLAVVFLYVRYQGLAWMAWLFYDIGPAVMAIIVLAAIGLARLTNGRDRRLWAISLVMMEITALTASEVAVLFIAAGLLIMLWDAPPRWLRRSASGPAVLNLAAPADLAAGLQQGRLLPLFLFFLKAGAFIFGSGLAIVPLLHEGVLTEHHWMSGGSPWMPWPWA